ncbi:MAG: altronate dehydratase [Oscillospiraceae bacterium]|nr:altronate dehydratase [Oscillospiraceae bacterium]
MQVIRINDNDNVAVALTPITKGDTVDISGVTVTAVQDIPAGHKICISPVKSGEDIIKYGYRIGRAKADIGTGEWVHIHNIQTALSGLLEYTYDPVPAQARSAETQAYFMGYNRPDGKVGVRNEIWIIPTVGCVNGIVRTLEKKASSLIGGSLEDIIAFTHPYGCSQLGDDQENTRKVLSDLICHPNAAAVLVVGLGCENSSIGVLKDYIGDTDSPRIRFLNCQDMEDEIEEGMKLLEELAGYAKGFRREKISADKLIVGLKCGGSDGFSGLTANPLVGRFSDFLAAQGGTTILTEVPEMFGAETILMDRCKDKETFDRTVCMINDFKSYFSSSGQPIYENPSPGNKAGGISTLEDKSLGCTQKSGTSPVNGVLAYGDRVQEKGLNLLSAPGNDLVAATALASAGAHIVLFTTGRGTPFACPVPTMKISSNSALAGKKSKWIDFNAGVIAEDKTIDDLAQVFFNTVLDVASGKKVRSEVAAFHDMAIFKKGVTL